MRALAIVCLLSTSAVAAEPGFAGSWWGTLEAGAMKIRVQFKLRHEASGWRGDTIIAQQGYSRAIDRVTVDGDAVQLELTDIHASYAGKLVDDNHIAGTLTQGLPFALALVRGEPPVVARPQNPKPPFPYASEDVSVDNRAAGVTLGCTLTHPRQAKFPVVVLITGSGQEDRDETVFGHKPFWIIADAFARAGVGALRCDDRGAGRSTGDFAKATSIDFVGDVEAELQWLRGRAGVDGKHLGLVGHSEGGMIAPMVAARDDGVAFLVLLAGPGVRGAELLVRQMADVVRAMGAREPQIAAAVAQQRARVDIVLNEKDAAAAKRKLMATGLSDGETAQFLSPWMRGFIALDPKPYLAKVRVPVLALNGSRDVQVSAELNLPAIKSALAGDSDVTTEAMPGLNHLFQRCHACTVAEYGDLEETIAPAALARIVTWTAQHAR